jgi:hypothetical protein
MMGEGEKGFVVVGNPFDDREAANAQQQNRQGSERILPADIVPHVRRLATRNVGLNPLLTTSLASSIESRGSEVPEMKSLSTVTLQ